MTPFGTLYGELKAGTLVRSTRTVLDILWASESHLRRAELCQELESSLSAPEIQLKRNIQDG
jgi:hypothetical protein